MQALVSRSYGPLEELAVSGAIAEYWVVRESPSIAIRPDGLDAEFLRELGADEVIDYQSMDPATVAHRLVPGGVDVVIDVIDVANSGPGLAGSAAAAKPGGLLISVLADSAQALADFAAQHFRGKVVITG